MWPQTLLGLTANGFKNGLYIFMMRQFFRGMPKELEEAAYVDGAGSLKTFLRIILPSSVSMMITVFLFSFVWQWLDITYTPIFMQNATLIQTNMNSLMGTITSLGLRSNAELTSSLLKNAGILMIIAPLTVLYVFTQRYFVESIARSGIVG
jgi:multiple sugar transport system permease protein